MADCLTYIFTFIVHNPDIFNLSAVFYQINFSLVLNYLSSYILFRYVIGSYKSKKR